MKKADQCAYGRVAIVTGASSGIGLSVARQLAGRGFRVYGLSRRTWTPPAVPGDGFLRVIPCDVNDEASASEASMAKAESGFGILVNCAGYGIAGPVEETSDADARAQMETNFFGTLRMCRLALPYLRAAGHGMIINTGSVAGFVSIPFQSHYSASKAAIDALSLALDAEARRFGTRCVLVQPGDTRTGFTDARITAAGAGRPDSPYAGVFERSVEGMAKSERAGDDPDCVAAAYVRLLLRRSPPPHTTPGSLLYKVVGVAHRLLPARLFRYIINLMYAS
jgi:short-subunit dehydrogenase